MSVIVVDSSALITLAGADALALLALSAHEAATVPEVYGETVATGAIRGFPDAPAIARAFEQGLVQVRASHRKEKLAGISRIDSLVLSLARELSAAALLVNDQALWRKAGQLGLAARFTADFVQDLFEAGKISRKRCGALLEQFVDNGRYSEEFMQAYRLGRRE